MSLSNPSEDDDDDFPPPVKQFKDEKGEWRCEECRELLGQHKPDCKTNKAYRVWLSDVRKSLRERPRPENQCSGCDQPKEGPHRFSCLVHGARAGQLVIPVKGNPTG